MKITFLNRIYLFAIFFLYHNLYNFIVKKNEIYVYNIVQRLFQYLPTIILSINIKSKHFLYDLGKLKLFHLN